MAKTTTRAYALGIFFLGIAMYQVYVSSTTTMMHPHWAIVPNAPGLSIVDQPDRNGLKNFSFRESTASFNHRKHQQLVVNRNAASNASYNVLAEKASLSRDFETPPPSTSSSSPYYMRACMIVRDENYILAEWVAYHYTVLPLRHLIICCDFDSIQDPMDVLGRWNGTDLQFQIWHSRDFSSNFRYKPNTSEEFHYVTRQSIFISKCLQYFHHHDPDGWVALVDPDEFVKLNPLDDFANFVLYDVNGTLPMDNSTTLPFLVHGRNETIGDRIKARKELRQRLGLETTHQGRSSRTSHAPANVTVLSVLEEYSVQHGTLPCHAMPRSRYSAVIKNYDTVANTSCRPRLDPVIASSPILNISRLSTIQFLYHSSVAEWTKVLIDLRRVPWEMLSDIEVRQNPHRPLHICPGRQVENLISLIDINHYVNFWHVYGGRQTSKRQSDVYARWSQSAHHRNYFSCHHMHAWLNQFVTQWGMTRAMYMLLCLEGT